MDKALEYLVPIEVPAGWGKDEVSCGGPATAAMPGYLGLFVALCPPLLPYLQLLSCKPPSTAPCVASSPALQAHVGAADHMAATTGSRTAAEFLNNVVRPMLAMEGDKLPVR